MFGYTNEDIVKKAVEGHSTITDGCALYDYDEQKVISGAYTTGTIENPQNHLIEIFRLEQGERGEFNYECTDCPFRDGWDGFDRKLYPRTQQECCMEVYIDEYFEDDFDNNEREYVESEVRDILHSHLGDTISKLNDIRIAISDIFEPYNYFNVRQDNWELKVLDTYVDYAMEDGFTTSIDANAYVDAEIQNLANIQYCEKNSKFWSEIGYLIEQYEFDKALERIKEEY